jgi:hypothetical protein
METIPEELESWLARLSEAALVRLGETREH